MPRILHFSFKLLAAFSNKYFTSCIIIIFIAKVHTYNITSLHTLAFLIPCRILRSFSKCLVLKIVNMHQYSLIHINTHCFLINTQCFLVNSRSPFGLLNRNSLSISLPLNGKLILNVLFLLLLNDNLSIKRSGFYRLTLISI